MKKTLITFVSILLLAGACWSDEMNPVTNEAKYYDNAKVVRIKNVDGEGFVQRSYEEGNEEATANLPLFEKDMVGTTDGRLGIYLGRLNYLRLDADSTVVLERIPQLRKTDLNVRLEQGSIYLDIENLDNEKGIEIQTPDCGIFILDKGVYRVNVGGNAQTEVLVMEGTAEVAGRESSRNVRENQKIVMSGGEIEERPYYFTASEKDDFDLWNETQNSQLSYARYGTSRYLQNGYEDTEYEMSRSGRWSYMPEFRSYAWIPYNTHSDWMPYSNGRWVWSPFYGYTWVSYDSCGWFTHHYGRWHWSYSYGWHWLPGYHWSPAWVSWFGNDYYYGWSPLSWWNRPVIIVNNRWDRHYDYRRGAPPHSRSTIIIRKNELSAANAQRVALKKGTLGQNTGQIIAYRGTAPSDRPSLAKVKVINADGKSVIYKQNSIVSSEKYRVQGSDVRNAVYKYERPNGENGSIYRKKSTEDSSTSAGGAYFKSRSSKPSRTGTSTRVSSSTSSAEKSSGKTTYRSKSGSSSKAKSSSSSSSTSSNGTKKKKKGEPEYLSRNSYKNSDAKTADAAPYASTQSKFSASSSAERFATRRVYTSKLKTTTAAAPYTTFRSPTRSNSGAYAPISRTNTRYNAPVSSASRGYNNSSAAKSYSSATSGQSSRAAGSTRTGSSTSASARSGSATSSQSSSGTAAKKK